MKDLTENEMELKELVNFLDSRRHLSHPESFLRTLDFSKLNKTHLLQIKNGYKIFE